MRYFPLLRGKQHELFALRTLASAIADSGRIIPIIEPVNENRSTQISLERFVEAAMPFLLVCNPEHGDIVPATVRDKLINPILTDYDRWIPTLYVTGETTAAQVRAWKRTYRKRRLAVVCLTNPRRPVASEILAMEPRLDHFGFRLGRVEQRYIDSMPASKRICVVDSFRREHRNADYEPHELFTDLNTRSGNPDDIDFGDFSIVGDYFSTAGGPAFTVALHHIHFGEQYALDIHHFLSDTTRTGADREAKTLQAIRHLVAAIDTLQPNDTLACSAYRSMLETQEVGTLGQMKQLAIQHHLEVMLHPNGLEPRPRRRR